MYSNLKRMKEGCFIELGRIPNSSRVHNMGDILISILLFVFSIADISSKNFF